MKKIKLGIIGIGNMGSVHAKNIIEGKCPEIEICAIADMGYNCVVVAPRVISKEIFKKTNQIPYFREERTEKGNRVRVFVPYYLHMTSRKETMGMSMNNHFHSVMHVIRREQLQPDLIYGHFIYQCGLTAARVGERLGIPSYCACGENSLRLQLGSKPYAIGLEYHGWQKILRKLDGVISVSGNNERLLRENHFIDPTMKIGVFPNAVDETKFYPMDKVSCRRELGFPEKAFIVAYTGTFSSNKGIDRLSEALKNCPDVYSIFMGQGGMEPDCDRILFKGRVPNASVAKYLNAADVFVHMIL